MALEIRGNLLLVLIVGVQKFADGIESNSLLLLEVQYMCLLNCDSELIVADGARVVMFAT